MVPSQGTFRLILVTSAEKIDLINKADGVFNVQIRQQSTSLLFHTNLKLPQLLKMKFLKLPLLLRLSNLTSAISIKPQQPIHDPAHLSSSSPLLALHKSLVEIESITGHEHDVAQYLISYLSSQNLTVETQDVGPGLDGRGTRQNILAYIGKQRSTKVLVSSHIDTVPPFWEYARQGDEIWGRGSVDAKGSIATQITAFEELREKGKIREGDVGLLFVVGEETGGEGKSQLLRILFPLLQWYQRFEQCSGAHGHLTLDCFMTSRILYSSTCFTEVC
jgi:hypothetical protein